MANLNNGKIHRKEYLKVILQLGMRSLSFLRNSPRCTQIAMTVFWLQIFGFHIDAKKYNVLHRFSELFHYPGSWFREFKSDKYFFNDRCKYKYIKSNNLEV